MDSHKVCHAWYRNSSLDRSKFSWFKICLKSRSVPTRAQPYPLCSYLHQLFGARGFHGRNGGGSIPHSLGKQDFGKKTPSGKETGKGEDDGREEVRRTRENQIFCHALLFVVGELSLFSQFPLFFFPFFRLRTSFSMSTFAGRGWESTASFSWNWWRGGKTWLPYACRYEKSANWKSVGEKAETEKERWRVCAFSIHEEVRGNNPRKNENQNKNLRKVNLLFRTRPFPSQVQLSDRGTEAWMNKGGKGYKPLDIESKEGIGFETEEEGFEIYTKSLLVKQSSPVTTAAAKPEAEISTQVREA